MSDQPTTPGDLGNPGNFLKHHGIPVGSFKVKLNRWLKANSFNPEVRNMKGVEDGFMRYFETTKRNMALRVRFNVIGGPCVMHAWMDSWPDVGGGSVSIYRNHAINREHLCVMEVEEPDFEAIKTLLEALDIPKHPAMMVALLTQTVKNLNSRIFRK